LNAKGDVVKIIGVKSGGGYGIDRQKIRQGTRSKGLDGDKRINRFHSV
jgi:hypothetical protein